MVPVSKNGYYEMKIESLSSEGNGVGRIDGFTVFVGGVCAGDTVGVIIDSVSRSFARGHITALIRASENRVSPVCDIYDSCGGCVLQHIDYETQLGEKRKIVENAMRRIGGFNEFALDGIIGAENPYRYRNKVVFHIGEERGKIIYGFYAPKSRQVIRVNDCLLCDKSFTKLADAVAAYANENGVSAYDAKTEKGVLKSVFLRRTAGGIMVVLFASRGKLKNENGLVERLRAVSEDVKSVILKTEGNIGKSSAVLNSRVLFGAERITEEIDGIEFSVSPDSFLQVNPAQTRRLYNAALDYADLKQTDTVMDIYCGIGTISLCAAKAAKKVIGIEIVRDAVLDAKRNAKDNGISNAEFYAGAAETIVPALIENGEKPDVVILDPPRAGSDEKTLAAIAAAKPERIVYVSCNCATLARDAKFLRDNGYSLSAATAVDMFPQTTHVEMVCLMSKLKSTQHIEVEPDMDELDLTAVEKKATYEEIKTYVRENYGFKVTALNIAQVKQKCGIIERENYNKPKSENAKQPQCPPEKETAIKEALRCFGMI